MKAPSFYIYLQIKLSEKQNGKKQLSFQTVHDCFIKYSIPKKLHRIILKEMELLKLIRMTEQDMFKVINCRFNGDEYENINRLTKRRKQLDNMLIRKEAFFDF